MVFFSRIQISWCVWCWEWDWDLESNFTNAYFVLLLLGVRFLSP